MRIVFRRLASGGALVAATVAGAMGMEVIRTDRAAPATGAQAALVVNDTTLSAAFRLAARRALPAVVHIQVENVRPVAQRQIPEGFRDFPFEEIFPGFEDMFERGRPAPRPMRGSGSGFIFRSDGYILTNNHVIDGADRVTVIMADGREFTAEVVGRDPNTDVAVIKVDAENLPVVALGDSDPLSVGEWVVALGYPLQLGSTATAGIVSATGRSLGILRQDQEASAPLEHFIQTDAAINPGNSGGPLVDLQGRVIGINSAIASPTGYYSGYGFAIPINLARRVAEDLIRYGEVHRPRLGVAVADLEPADAEVYGLDRPRGAEIVRIESGSPAAHAGLNLGDVIVAVEGDPIETSGELTELLTRYDPGQEIELEVVRYGEHVDVELELGAFAPVISSDGDNATGGEDRMGRLGLGVAPLTPRIAEELGTEPGTGVVIAEIEPYGPAARAGLARGMLIERFNGQTVESVEELEDLVDNIEPGQAVSLLVRLPDGSRTIVNYNVRD